MGPPRVSRNSTAPTPNNTRTIHHSLWTHHEDLYLYRVTGSGFLHHMVRNLVGTFTDAANPAASPHPPSPQSSPPATAPPPAPPPPPAASSFVEVDVQMTRPPLTPATAQAQHRITRLATQLSTHRAFHWLHLHQPQLRLWQLEFLAIPAPPFHESARAAWFLDRFHALGLTNVHLDEAGNALAELVPTSGEAPAATSSPSAELQVPGRLQRHRTDLPLHPFLLVSAHPTPQSPRT